MTSQGLSPNLRSQKKRSAFSISLFGKYAAPIVFLILVILIPLTLIMMNSQKELLYQEKVNAGEIFLSQLANRASLPLLENDLLNLQGLIKEMKEVKGILYVAIVDNKKVIRAHTDSSQIGFQMTDLSSNAAFSRAQVLPLSRPVVFMNQNVGWVVLGLSLDVINDQIKKEHLSLIKSSSLFGLVALLLGAGTALLLAWWAHRDLHALSKAEGEEKSRHPHPTDFSVTRTQATILSAGIREFKAYSETRNPETLMTDLNEFFSIVTDGILEHGGYVDNISGDVIIGVFRNSPFQKNHTTRAIRCAISIRKTLNEAGLKGNPILTKAGFGISSGVILSGPLLSQEGRETTFIGESFKEASSLNLMAGPGEIIVSKEVYQSIEKLVSAEPLPPRETTQRTESWESFRLLHIAERKDEV